MSCKNPVLALQRHEIRHRPQRDEVEIITELDGKRDRVVLEAQLLEQSMAEFKHETDRAKISPRRIRIALVRFHMRVDQNPLGQHLLARTMVIDHQYINPLRAQVGHLRDRVRAAIQRDKQIWPATLERAINRTARQPIAVRRAARHHKPRLEPKTPQHHHQQGRATDAVDIVIAQHHNHLLLCNRGA